PQRLGAGRDPGAPPSPLRGQQRLSARAGEERAAHLGDLGREAARGDHRAARAPVVRGRAVPPRVPLQALGPASALRRLHPRGPRPPGGQPAGEGMTAEPRVRTVTVGGTTIGGGAPLVLIGGPCAIEHERDALLIAARLRSVTSAARVPFIYKSSYDKANRFSVDSYRGPGLKEGLRILARVKETTGLPVLSDVHDVAEVGPAAEVLDVLQVPAFLCRQTDLLLACGATRKPVNVKKGQFLAPRDMGNLVEKVRSTGNEAILLTERGTSFGYNNLVVDFRGLPIMRSFGYPVVFDATHAVQLPGGA